MFNRQTVEELIARGASIAEFAREAAKPERTLPKILLARCAVPRWLDQALYEKVIAKGILDSPPWSDLTSSPEFEQSDPIRKRYHFREPTRSQALEEWQTQKETLQSYAADLADYFLNGDPLDRFAALALSKPEVGLAEFQRLYLQADESFDLARCDTLLRILRNRFVLLDPSLRAAMNDREQYYRSRSLFADDYWRTVAFIERSALAEHFETWERDPQRWVLHLHGKGGLGKTIFLRRLIARRCVVEINGRRIPVARLDSDLLDRPALSRWPWLALLPAAQQLNIQLPTSPFNELLDEFGEFASLLRKPAGQGRDASRLRLLEDLEPAAERLAAEVPALFRSKLGGNQVVLVIDTIEDLLLHYRTGFSAMLNLLASLREVCPGLRLVLSGRYNLADPKRLPKFMAKHCPPEDRLRIEGFSRDESMRYLRDLRGLPESVPLAAICDKSKGNPFALSLLADLSVANPSLTAAEINRYPSAEFAYLIERIIDRIPDKEHAVAWLLRYAAVPRQLTFDFAHDVLGEHLQREMVSGGRLDRRAEAKPFYGGREVWRKTPERALVKVWDDLCQYASDNSWMSLEDGVVHLQPEVRLPMRQLLRYNQGIYPKLQKAAAIYFESLATKDPASWGVWTAEGLYHRFHLVGTDAAVRWRKCLASRKALDPAVRAGLAAIPLSSDFVDDQNRPVAYDGQRLVDYKILAEAAFHSGYALLANRLRIHTDNPDAAKLEEEFGEAASQLRIFERHLDRSPVSAARRALIEGARLLISDNLPAAEQQLRKALRSEKDPGIRIVLLSLLARCLIDSFPDAADKRLSEAAAAARRLPNAPLSSAWIEYRRGRRLEERQELSRALKAYETAFERTPSDRMGAQNRSELYGRITSILRKSGRWTKAAAFGGGKSHGRTSLEEDKALEMERTITAARVALDRYDPQGAARAFTVLSDSSNPDYLELMGSILSAGMHFERAEHQFSAAAAADASSTERPARILVKKAQMFLEGLGNPRLALETLDSLRELRFRGKFGPFLERSLLAARAHVRMGKSQRARAIFHKLGLSLEGAWPRTRLRVAAHELAHVEVRRARVRAFLQQLAKVEPPEARFPLLDPCRYFDPRLFNGYRVSIPFRRAVPKPSSRTPDFALKALLWGCGAELFGGPGASDGILLDAWEKAIGQPHLQREIRAAIERLGSGYLPHAEMYLEAYEREFRSLFPNLLATAWIEEAERMQESDPTGALVLAGRARETLQIQKTTASIWEVRLNLLLQDEQRETLIPKAVQTAIRLGDRRARKKAAHSLAGLKRRAKRKWDSSSDLLAPRNDIHLLNVQRPDGNSLQLSFKPVAGPKVFRDVPPGGDDFTTQLSESISTLSAPGLLRVMTKDGSPAFAKALRVFLAPALESLKNGNVALFVQHGGLSAVPWEMAFDPMIAGCVHRINPDSKTAQDTVVWIQTMLLRAGRKLFVDGIFGPQSALLLQSFGGASLLESRRKVWDVIRQEGRPSRAAVRILQASPEHQRQERRGHGLEGTDVGRLYYNAGIEAEPIWDPTAERLLDAFDGPAPPLIHVVASFQESSRTGEIQLNLGGGADEIQSKALLGVELFTSILRRVEGLLPPFVIVEAILPPDSYDQARQAFLRNAFCSELFRLGRTRGVLGTGLYHEEFLHQSLKIVVGAARESEVLGTLQHRLWTMPGHVVPPALFTTDPELPILA
jgi:tetratricopeptide (TPR) repeat protein